MTKEQSDNWARNTAGAIKWRHERKKRLLKKRLERENAKLGPGDYIWMVILISIVIYAIVSQ